ncbi:MAG: sulfite exporter TauE/SafE family protein [Cardiobacteriaceae bacterium]|nr:sulfite exporter TauE/SafE family protein [Cardiobacteriaceae bacterium]
MDLHFYHYLLLAVLGVICGVINVMAGGGSNIILPVMMMMGLPAQVANATNRVGILLQSIVGVRGFLKAGKLATHDLPGILTPTIIGGICGAIVAAFAPSFLIKPLLLGTMLAMAAIMLFVPSVVMPPKGTIPLTIKQGGVRAWFWLWLAGVYGGFVQAGVGFVLITAISGCLRYDIVRSSALKLVCTLCFTAVALLIFVLKGQVEWLIGLVLAAGNMVGAHYGVRLAVKVKSHTLKWVMFFMTLVAVVAALLK